jgi:hypothetical protein
MIAAALRLRMMTMAAYVPVRANLLQVRVVSR